jgi:hypothetical protein
MALSAKTADAGNSGNPAPGALDQFLQPQSMVTPGALGAMAMLGTNTLALNFPDMSSPIIAVALSFLFGLAATVKSSSFFEKIVYYLLNSIIIFSVAAGSNKIAQQHASLSLPSAAYADSLGFDSKYLNKVQFFRDWFPPSKQLQDQLQQQQEQLNQQQEVIQKQQQQLEELQLKQAQPQQDNSVSQRGSGTPYSSTPNAR